MQAKRRFWPPVVPPASTREILHCRAKNGAIADATARPSDGRVGNCVAWWEKVGYGGLTNRPEWRGSSHSATPV
jgi:hypothetical protein